MTGAVLGLSSTSTSVGADPIEIDECTTISEPGEYVLTDDLTAEGDCLGLYNSDITLDGNGYTISGDGTGIGISAEGSPVVRDLTIENFETGCYSFLPSNDITFENTVVSDTAVGIDGDPRTNISIRDSIIKDNDIGVGPTEGLNITITESTLSGNESAVSTGLGNFMEVENSTVRDNGTGIEAGEGTFVDNTITSNDGYGFRLIGLIAPTDLGTATIIGNDIQNNGGPGIEFTSSSGEVRENTIAGNQSGIMLSGVDRDTFGDKTPDYQITKNNIENNTEFGVGNNSVVTATASCNYWGDPTGPVHEENPFEDPEGDEIDGDVEFIPWSVEPIRDGEAICSGGQPIGDFRNPPTDPDGDGLYEDINGDGESNIVDVQALFKNQENEVIQNNPSAFDFNGDGTVNVVDVQKLFSEV